MIELKNLRPDLVERFDYDGIEAAALSALNIKEQIHNYARMGDAFVILADEKPIVIGGAFTVWPGVGQTWLLLNQDARSNLREVFTIISQTLQDIAVQRCYHRLQTHAINGESKTTSLIEHLGFEYEGTMRHYMADGRHMIIYGKVGA